MMGRELMGHPEGSICPLSPQLLPEAQAPLPFLVTRFWRSRPTSIERPLLGCCT